MLEFGIPHRSSAIRLENSDGDAESRRMTIVLVMPNVHKRLLHGATMSGKRQIYKEFLANKSRQSGRDDLDLALGILCLGYASTSARVSLRFTSKSHHSSALGIGLV